MPHRKAILLSIAAAVLGHASPARADPTPSERIAARALYEEARALFAEHDFGAACPKFEASERLDPGIGTLYQLGACYEGQGRLARAWTTFLEVADAARTAGQTARAEAAKGRADALAARLPRLRITWPAGDPPRVELDGAVLAEALEGTPVPVDPGPHEVTARAAGKAPWQVTVEATAGSQLEVAVPPLGDDDRGAPAPAPRDLPAPPAGPAPARESPSPLSVTSAPDAAHSRVGPLALGSGGAVSLVAGVVSGVVALETYAQAATLCPAPHTNCNGTALSKRTDSNAEAWAANVAIPAGAVMLAVAVVWWVTQGRPAPAGAHVGWQTVSVGW